MVANPGHIWLGLEYFCNESDPLWRLSDPEMIALAKQELSKIKIVDPADVLDGTVLRVEKAYPAYFGTFERFGEIREFVDRYQNLFLIGRNGMHRYNNQDHSMLTAMMAVENIIAGKNEKDNLWGINTETEYYEEASESSFSEHRPI
jgi:protoporphyrinogen oxidase